MACWFTPPASLATGAMGSTVSRSSSVPAEVVVLTLVSEDYGALAVKSVRPFLDSFSTASRRSSISRWA